MRSRCLAILLTLAVMLAVGVCPCGRAWMAGRLVGALMPVASAAGADGRGHCPACHGGDRGSPRPDRNAPDPRLCAATVSGDVPSVPVGVPAVDVTPAIFQPVVVLALLNRVVVDRDTLLRPGLPPPPTLLNLSCCLNT